jgi:hypothetical protein
LDGFEACRTFVNWLDRSPPGSSNPPNGGRDQPPNGWRVFIRPRISPLRRHHCDGVVCGHIHTPAINTLSDIEYDNCGDWVESCTALVEHDDGRFELVHYHETAHDPAEPVAA